jgi:hypothetical protein
MTQEASMTRLIVALASSLLLAACAHTPHGEASLETWSGNHPQASEELGVWVRNHPQAAAQFFEWDAHNPERAHEFVTWTITHPGQPIDVFVATHPGWPYFDRIAMSHRPGADAFMAWCRRHPNAAEALMNHPGGLAWAGHHLYASSWHMETPGQ